MAAKRAIRIRPVVMAASPSEWINEEKIVCQVAAKINPQYDLGGESSRRPLPAQKPRST